MPAQIVITIVAIAKGIYEQGQKVEANEEQTKCLTDRVRVIIAAIQGLSQLPDTRQFRNGLENLKTCLVDIKIFIEQFGDVNWFKKILCAGGYQESFANFNQRLADALAQLNVGLSAQQLINQEQDRQAEKADHAKIESKLDNILAQQRQTFLAVQQSRFDKKEMEAIVQRQLASVEARIRQYTRPDAERPLFPSDLQVNFFDLTFEKKETDGTLGTTCTGIWHEQRVTIKFVEQIATDNDRAQFIREAQVISRLHNDFITPFYGACIEDNRLCFLIQYMEKGNLEDNLSELSLPERLSIAQDLAKGLHYLHENKVTHGDIKPKSVLINRHNAAKWSDFGLSQTQQISIASSHVTSQETRWQAPECWQARFIATPASDIYSFGMLLWTLMTGKKPYAKYAKDSDIIEHVQKGQRETIGNDIPPDIARLIQACWVEDPEMRPRAFDVVQTLNKLRPPSPSGDELYIEAKNVQQNSDEQYRLLERSGKKGCAKALNSLGIFALNGLGGRPVDKIKAYALFQRAANGGVARGFFNSAAMCEHGDGVPKDLPLALQFYRQALAADPNDKQTQEKIALLSSQSC